MAITKDQIFSVADELDAAGQSPTLAAVRKALGGGSFTTISEAMTEWKARKAEKEAPIREAAPQAITDLLGAFGAEVWSAALALANGRLAAERAALEEARLQIEADKAEAAELADQVSAELEAMKGERTTQDAEIQRLHATLGEREARIATLSEGLASATARLDETRRHADQLNAELERVGAQNAEMLRSMAEVTKLADQVTIELNALKAGYAAQEAELASSRRHAADHEARAAGLAHSLALAEARFDEATRHATQLHAELERVSAQNAELIRTVSTLTSKPGRGSKAEQVARPTGHERARGSRAARTIVEARSATWQGVGCCPAKTRRYGPIFDTQC